MKRLKYFLIIFSGLIISFLWFFPPVWRCLLIRYDSFEEIQPNVFVSKGTSAKQRLFLLKNINLSSQRIKDFWGKKYGKATIIYCDKATLYAKYCASSEGAGCSVGTPFGSWIILNYDGNNADVIAHEMCHDELQTTVGWLKTKKEIPTWFDEGLALQLDDRIVASNDTIQRYINYQTALTYFPNITIRLSSLRTNKQFFAKDSYFTKIAYLISAKEVAHKISQEGKSSIWGILEKVKQGQHFEDVYILKSSEN